MNENNKKIYLDYAAATPLDEEVFEAMRPYFSEEFGNPSSIHQFGQKAQEAVIAARQIVAEFLNCEANEIIFTSGATEGNNTAIKGIAGNKKLRGALGEKLHIIVSAFEHDCVLASAESLARDEVAEATFLPVNRDGFVELEEVKKNIRDNTVLVSIMYANNEVGTIQPIAEIGEMLKILNENRSAERRIYFHTDAAQAVNYLDCDTKKLGVDLMTISAHKIYGPKGVGALFVKKGTSLKPFMDGGEQEFKLRSGTHNVPGIVGLGAAIEKLKTQKLALNKVEGSKLKTIEMLRDKLIDDAMNKISGVFLNGSRERRLPNNVNLRFEGVEGESIVMALDLEGIAFSTGSACAAKSLRPSHVLKAMGMNDLEAHSSVRFSLGRQTTGEQIERVLDLLPLVIQRLRNISGNLGNDLVEKGKLPDDFGC